MGKLHIFLCALITIISISFTLYSVRSSQKRHFIIIGIALIVTLWAALGYLMNKRQREEIVEEVKEVKREIENLPQRLSILLNPIIEAKIERKEEFNKPTMGFEEMLFSEARENQVFIHKNLGIYYYKRNDFGIAEKELQRAIQFDRKDIDSHRYLGIIYSKKQDFNRAISIYQKIVNLKPDVSTLEEQLQLAVLYEYIGRDASALQSALKLYNRIIGFNDAYVKLAKDRIEYIRPQIEYEFERKRRSGTMPVGLIPPIVVISLPSPGSKFALGREIILKGTIANPRYGNIIDYYVVEYRNLSKEDDSWQIIKSVDFQGAKDEIIGGVICKWTPISLGRYLVKVIAKDLNGHEASHQIQIMVQPKE